MSISPRQLTDSLLAADHIADRHLIAAFVAEATTQPAPNPFPETSVGAVLQIWRQRAAEFQSFAVAAAGLNCLLTSLSGLSLDEPLMQEILRAGPHTINVFHRGDGCRIVGAVLTVSRASPCRFCRYRWRSVPGRHCAHVLAASLASSTYSRKLAPDGRPTRRYSWIANSPATPTCTVSGQATRLTPRA